ncbi:MalY/PatB family protein [Pseudogemmobacter faecipullorum]|uniref:cysteine-S-conjugate beta-lyase n=1 Tax=Pseudogemmobacter faecipullorum TaxID=2755041 RepID=A0ABS8CGZ3_9RHOB|nr:MalY/PatB family protein [Pseudogemmobacter faecipullorum]MCB5408640.1 pyridoxal phosphate-dependent aminotransferase [Pseudogemmobacter faecipullorum]
MDFDSTINRLGSHCVKWDMMEALYGIPADRGLAMWVADMEFRPPAAVQRALQDMLDHGIYGYFGDESKYLAAIQWWMKTRHGWEIDPAHIFTTHGLVNAVGICIDTWTAPGDGVVVMSPVYHAFARVIRASGRALVECELRHEAGRYALDIEAWDQQLSGREKMLILCSPHNPGGRVWSEDELQAIADFAARHDLILISDEIHADLVFPGQQHHVLAKQAPQIRERLVTLTSTTKTFNIAGAHTGNVIIGDAKLRGEFAARMNALGISPNSFGLHMATAAASPEGAEWLDRLIAYLDENRRLFDAAMNALPGVRSMPLEATYLSWVDFSGTGLSRAELLERIEGQAAIASNHGDSFGKGGESFLRFNIAAPRAHITEAIARLQQAFADLQ